MSGTDIVPAKRPIETASATTDPDNANSGAFAYVLTAGVLVALVALCVVLSGTIGDLAARGLEELTAGGSDGLVQQYDGGSNGGSSGNGTGQSTGGLSLSDALDLDLAPYYLTVDDGVSAMDYAGVSDDVRSYVRGILSADGQAQEEVARLLNQAARSDDPATGMQAVVDAANSGRAAIESLDTPTFSDATVASELVEARQATLERWDAIIAELQVLVVNDDESISRSDLTKADNDVQEKTEEAAEDFTEALQAAAQQ